MSAAAVVEAAREYGMEISEAFVYNIRSSARRGVGVIQRPRLTRGLSSQGLPRDEQTFRRLVVALGTRRAFELIEQLEAELGDTPAR